jgi:protein-L-isoaspartate O-methyltransferase
MSETADGPETVDNPFFARLWSSMSTREPESIRELRRENLAGLTGRVLEIGAGTGTNFALYPPTVTEVVAIEPERRLAVLAREAAANARVPVSVSTDTVERYAASAGEPFDAVVCSLVLCSIADPDDVLRQLVTMLRPGGELRFLEHVASTGMRARLQRLADATVWPRLLGNCHTHRHTEKSITAAGFEVVRSRHEWVLPAWVPVPSSETAIGLAVRPI